jgi:hypothetical protein
LLQYIRPGLDLALDGNVAGEVPWAWPGFEADLGRMGTIPVDEAAP